MNWKSQAVSEVSKEKIWKEHCETEATHRQLNDNFRINPLKAMMEKPLPEPISPRGKRFLDRDRAFLETLQKKQLGLSRSPSQSPRSSTHGLPALGPQSPSTPRGSLAASRTVHATQNNVPLPTIPHPPPRKDGTVASDANPGADETTSVPHFANFHHLLVTASKPPNEKFSFPRTESQEIGWLSAVKLHTPDKRFFFNIKNSEMSKYASSLARARILSGGKQ